MISVAEARGREKLQEGRERAQEAQESLEGYVRSNPIKSLAYAAGAGVLLAAVLRR